ncbi:ABC transporter ATP-binding protein [Kribbella soli]|uniref:ATP-binding cassette domain-containing protein n=1 Tax=Kribbella soli TaxID=1124743 RepID=A0A4V2LYG9_9ACTN|nr:ATP-binding cassette domain-containing protein [Kribbella soli]TCC04256.1 ATP-binding cassette domain-containing protein [Kribbella soli]
MSMIVAEHLVKQFHRRASAEGPASRFRSWFAAREAVRAVDDISLTVDKGEIVGFLGPNGAGKSTTIKMLTGILVPTAGRVEVAGIVPWRHRRRNALNIGVVFGQRSQLWFDLPLRRSLEAIRDLYSVSAADYRLRMSQFDDLLDLGSFLDTPVRSLSLGQRIRGDLAAATLYRPPVLYLDEPTVGLDVVAKVALRDLITSLNVDGQTTVMLTTHDMDDVEQLCQRIMVIDGGRMLYEGDLNDLKRRFAPYRDLIVTPRSPGDADRIDSGLATRVSSPGSAKVTLRFDPEEVSAPEVIQSVSSQFDVSDLSLLDPQLEDVVRRLYGDSP